MSGNDVIMTRTCKVQRSAHDNPIDLKIDFLRPGPDGEGAFASTSRIHCKYFDRSFRTIGEDEVQAFTLLLDITKIYLETQRDHHGYLICWEVPGDLEIKDFWRYKV
jgi:hypothetical protein